MNHFLCKINSLFRYSEYCTNKRSITSIWNPLSTSRCSTFPLLLRLSRLLCFDWATSGTFCSRAQVYRLREKLGSIKFDASNAVRCKGIVRKQFLRGHFERTIVRKEFAIFLTCKRRKAKESFFCLLDSKKKLFLWVLSVINCAVVNTGVLIHILSCHLDRV